MAHKSDFSSPAINKNQSILGQTASIKTLLGHSAVYGLGGIVGQSISFFLLPVYTRVLTPSDYGILDLLNTSSAFASGIMGMGLAQAILRCYYQVSATEEEKKRLLGTSFILLLSSALLGSMVFSLFSETISRWVLQDDSYSHLVFLLGPVAFLSVLTNFPLATLRTREKSLQYSLTVLAQLVVSITFNILLVVWLRMGVKGVLLGNLAGLSTPFISILFIRREFRLSFSTKFAVALLKYGTPMVPTLVFNQSITLSNRYFLNAYMTTRDVGIFGLGFRLATVVQILLTVPVLLAYPAFAFKIEKEPLSKETYSRVLMYFVIAGGIFTTCFALFSKEIIWFIAPPIFHEAARVVPLLAASFFIYGMFHILSIGIQLSAQTKFFPLILGLGALSNAACNFILVPKFGLMGAAAAIFVSYSIMTICTYSISNRHYPIPYQLKRIGMALLVFALAIFAGVEINLTNIVLQLLLKAAITSALLVALIITGLIGNEDLVNIKRTIAHLRINFNRGLRALGSQGLR